MTSTEELERLMAEAQTDEPWTVVWYGDDSLPAIAIHRSTEDRICFMPTIQHPADGVQFEANAALIVAAVNALPELVERVRRLEEALKPFADEADKWANCIDKDAQEILIAHPIDVTVDSYGEIDGLNDAAFTLGDLRRARAALKETGQ